MAEIRVFHHDHFLCRAICPELADRTISLKEITAARNARRRDLRSQITERTSIVDRLIEAHQPVAPGLPITAQAPAPKPSARSRLKRYREE